MLGIKLPGSRRVKLIILSILVVLAMWIIGNKIVDNKQQLQNQTKQEEKKTVVSGDTYIKSAEDEDNNKESSEEQSMYDNAYGLFHSGEYQNSINIANQIIEKYPESYKAYSIRGIAKAYDNNYSEGMKDIDKALEIKSDYGYGLFNKALCYELYEHYDEAIEWYNKALEVEDYVWSYYGIASIYGRKGDVDKTSTYLQKAIDTAKTEEEKQNVKEEAKTEEDFDNVRGNEKFEQIIK